MSVSIASEKLRALRKTFFTENFSQGGLSYLFGRIQGLRAYKIVFGLTIVEKLGEGIPI